MFVPCPLFRQGNEGCLGNLLTFSVKMAVPFLRGRSEPDAGFSRTRCPPSAPAPHVLREVRPTRQEVFMENLSPRCSLKSEGWENIEQPFSSSQ